jgi:glycosyltransferase involved in cell wall biosynthesis
MLHHLYSRTLSYVHQASLIGTAMLVRAGYERAMSIVVSTRDQLSSLTLMLDSIGCQALPKRFWEVVVVDRDSRDGTAEMTARKASEHSLQIRSIRVSGRDSEVAALNAGIEAVRGAIVVFLSDDCLIGDDCLSQQLFLQARHPCLLFSTDVAYVHTHLFSPADGEVIGVPPVPMDLSDARATELLFHNRGRRRRVADMLLQGEAEGESLRGYDISGSSVPADMLAKLGGFDTRFESLDAATIDFTIRARLMGLPVQVVNGLPVLRQFLPEAVIDADLIARDRRRILRPAVAS